LSVIQQQSNACFYYNSFFSLRINITGKITLVWKITTVILAAAPPADSPTTVSCSMQLQDNSSAEAQ